MAGPMGICYSQAFKHNTDLFICGELPAGSFLDLLYDIIRLTHFKLLSGAWNPDYGAEKRRFQVVSCMQETT